MSRPLASLRVIDCGTYVASPAAATILSDFGAEVIKIERPPHGDPYRYLASGPQFPRSDLNYCWILDSRNKKSLALNLADQAGQEIMRKLAATADVFVTNFQPDLLKKFHITFKELASSNKRLIYAHVTGYGEQGAEAGLPGYDVTAYFARTGLMSELRTENCEPCAYPMGAGDHPTSVTLAAAIFFALYQRELTGCGMKVSTSLMATGAWANSCAIQAAFCGAQWPAPSTRVRETVPDPLMNVYRSRDGLWFYVCLADGVNGWPRLCRAMSRPELADDPRYNSFATREEHAPALISILDAAFAQKDLAEWRGLFNQYEVAWAPVQKTASVIHDRQMEANGVFAHIEVPGFGEAGTINNPLTLEGVDLEAPRPAPEIGEHTAEILGSLGMSSEAIAELEKRGVVTTRQAVAAPGHTRQIGTAS